MPKELTERQKGVLRAIQEWITEHGYPPTIRELGKRLGIRSLRGVTTHLDAIAKKGHLTRKRSARGIRLLVEAASSTVATAMHIPIVGRIAAGQPLLAQEQVEGHLAIDASLFGKTPSSATHFALRVRGDSMINAGILDGDYVIVRQQPSAENGEIVVALIGEEATVKRFFKENDHIRLQPEHPSMDPIVVDSKQPLEVLGKVIAVIRTLSR